MNDNQAIYEAYSKEQEQPKMVTDEVGTKRWFLNGWLHREDGPAVDWSASWPGHPVYYYVNGSYYTDMDRWAKAVLKHQGNPDDPESVAKLVQTVLANRAKEMI